MSSDFGSDPLCCSAAILTFNTTTICTFFFLPSTLHHEVIRIASLSFQTPLAETIYFRWVFSILVFVACQGCTPWFEAKVGHLSGITALNKTTM
jgi:hypothetical protein